MEYLSQQIRHLQGETAANEERINAAGKHVLVIGGGDAGSDCVGTAIRQGALSVTQIEIMPQPPMGHNPVTPWPNPYPQVLKTSSSHEEGCQRRWQINTLAFHGDGGMVKEVDVEEIRWEKDANNRFTMVSSGKTETIRAELVLLALGFVHPVQEGLLNELGVAYDVRGNVSVGKDHASSVARVFATGDAMMGASLVVKAIASGRKVAEDIHRMLQRAIKYKQ